MDKRTKRKKDIGKIATRIMGLVLAAMMVLSVAATLIYYIALINKIITKEVKYVRKFNIKF